MLTQDQINEKVNAIIAILEKYDIPYKSLDNMDGSRNGIRMAQMNYFYPVDGNGVENNGNYVRFRYYFYDGSYNDYELEELDDFIGELEEGINGEEV
ncbi:MAG: hypothetical protein MJZ34_11140 [Paludibacteraceae bacterium]|nr:hypothetical protein [Paludibacteraceae bacterium]